MATLTAQAKEKRAVSDTDRARASCKSISRRNCRNEVRVQNELGRMERSLRDASSRGPDGVSLAAIRTIAPVSYSRMVRARPRPLGAFPLDLPEKAQTFSGLLGALINTVVFTFGALDARRFNVSPSKTILTASPSGAKVSGSSA